MPKDDPMDKLYLRYIASAAAKLNIKLPVVMIDGKEKVLLNRTDELIPLAKAMATEAATKNKVLDDNPNPFVKAQFFDGKLVCDDDLRETIKQYICEPNTHAQFFGGIEKHVYRDKVYFIDVSFANLETWSNKKQVFDLLQDSAEQQQFEMVLSDKSKVWVVYRETSLDGSDVIGRTFAYEKSEFSQ
jgi:hypothetical protein